MTQDITPGGTGSITSLTDADEWTEDVVMDCFGSNVPTATLSDCDGTVRCTGRMDTLRGAMLRYQCDTCPFEFSATEGGEVPRS